MKHDHRVALMREMVAAGKTLQQIAEQFGVTRERVRQILAAGGVSQRAGHRQRIAERAGRIAAAVRDLRDGMTIEDAAEKHGVYIATLRRAAHAAGLCLRPPSVRSALVAGYLLRTNLSAKQIAKKVGCISCYVHVTARLLRSHGFDRPATDG